MLTRYLTFTSKRLFQGKQNQETNLQSEIADAAKHTVTFLLEDEDIEEDDNDDDV